MRLKIRQAHISRSDDRILHSAIPTQNSVEILSVADVSTTVLQYKNMAEILLLLLVSFLQQVSLASGHRHVVLEGRKCYHLRLVTAAVTVFLDYSAHTNTQITVNTNITELNDYLEHLINSTNMKCLTPKQVISRGLTSSILF